MGLISDTINILPEEDMKLKKIIPFPGSVIEEKAKKRERKPRSVTNNKTVDPISDKKDIEFVIDYITSRGTWHDLRDCCLFVTGINLGLRCGDLVKLQVKDILNTSGTFIPFVLKEEKTKKLRYLYVNDSAQTIISNYLHTLPNLTMETYLFASQKKLKESGDKNHYIGVKAVNDLMKDIQKALGDKYNLGSHSMRKTFGRHIFMDNQGSPEILAYLMKIFKHSSQEQTLAYIGLEADTEKGIYMDLRLGLDAVKAIRDSKEGEGDNLCQNSIQSVSCKNF